MARLLWLLVVFFAAVSSSPAQVTWKLIWSDEFDGAANTLPDAKKWAYDLGGGGWGNQELETYTKNLENVFQDGSGTWSFVRFEPIPADTRRSSETQGKFDVQYGKMEAKIKIPYGQGMWPAFWMLGTNINSVGWPSAAKSTSWKTSGRSRPSRMEYAWTRLFGQHAAHFQVHAE